MLSIQILRRRAALFSLVLGVPLLGLPGAVAVDAPGVAPTQRPLEGLEPRREERGEAVYRSRCASCHGADGQGVDGAYEEPLAGDRSALELARYIEKRMPSKEPELCVGDDAEAVARFVFDAFYSPIAQARLRPARREISRLTVTQLQATLTDLVASFRPSSAGDSARGLRARYHKDREPRGDAVETRVDARVHFDFHRGDNPPDGLSPKGFSVRWEGSLVPDDTGRHEIIVRSDQAARLWLNDRETPLIDAWVRSGDESEFRAELFLLEGRAYPIRLEFSSSDQGVKKERDSDAPVPGRIELAWRPPFGVEEIIPTRALRVESGVELYVLPTEFPPDDRSQGYARGDGISRAFHDALVAAAIHASDHVAEHVDVLAGVRREDRRDDASLARKLRAFALAFVERAFRRPLSDEEVALYVDRQLTRESDRAGAIRRVALLALQSPRFLLLDFASRDDDPYVRASRLSYALLDSLPDEALLAAAAAGELATSEGVHRHAERLLGDTRAHGKLRRFFHHWLEIEGATDLTKSPERFPGFDARLVADLRVSLDRFLDEVIWGRGDFRELFRAEGLIANERIGRYYGLEDGGTGGDTVALDEAEWRRWASPPDAEPRRGGVLAHPYLLARFAYPETTSPIHRGVFLGRRVLGRRLLPPPDAFSPLAPDLHPELTTRERVALQTSPEMCQSCHVTINALGFALEGFDADGRVRREERGKPIDDSGSYVLPSGELERFGGAGELGAFLAESPEVRRAFARQLFHHVAGQSIGAYDLELPGILGARFAAQEYDVRRLLAEIATIATCGPTRVAELRELTGEIRRF